MHRKIKVIFCDEKRCPQSELIPYYGAHDSSAKIRQQTTWDAATKGEVWAQIVAEKIRRQQHMLCWAGQTERAEMLAQYAKDVKEADAGNREGHAAKVYFSGLFGLDFSRAQDNAVNAALNYGYAILLAAFNREIAAAGYLTQLGIFHDNMFNPYNLASDMMEPYRPLVDRVVWEHVPAELDRETKNRLLGILNERVEIDGEQQYVSRAIGLYCRSVLAAMNQKNTDELRFYRPVERKPAEVPIPVSQLAKKVEEAAKRAAVPETP